MKEILQKALRGTRQEKEEAILRIKALPRTTEGVFELSSLDENAYRAAGMVFPLYTEYETQVNKKVGYPDIIAQQRVLNKKLGGEYTQENVVCYLAMLKDTIAVISPEIYENYRELVEMFRTEVKKAIAEFGLEAGKEKAGFEDAKAASLFGQTLSAAFALELLLQEKYEQLAKTVEGIN